MPGAARALPTILVTGASGTVGRHFLTAARDDHLIYALARRSQREARVEPHPNIRWIQADIGHWPALKDVVGRIQERGGVDFVLHLAGYYDFEYKDHPEYHRTNVNGTRHMLELARHLGVKRFIFASSLAACDFPAPGMTIHEKTPADADFHYARSKRTGEVMVRTYSRYFPTASVRLAAVYSDWCEYPPVYVFLSTWLSRSWRSRILAGRGEAAVSYIHVQDLNRLFLRIFHHSHALPRHDVYAASPNGSTSQRALYDIAVRYFFGERHRPVLMPKALAWLGAWSLDLAGRLVGRRPFERPWMLKYTDLRLEVDASYTHRALDWRPATRLHLRRRLLFLIENMVSSPEEWHRRNAEAMKRSPERPALRIYEALKTNAAEVVQESAAAVLDPARQEEFPHAQRLGESKIERYLELVLQLLMTSVRAGDRTMLLEYANALALRRFEAGFELEELRRVLLVLEGCTVARLAAEKDLAGLGTRVLDTVSFPLQLARDGMEDTWEEFAVRDKPAAGPITPATPTDERFSLARIVEELDTLYRAPER